MTLVLKSTVEDYDILHNRTKSNYTVEHQKHVGRLRDLHNRTRRWTLRLAQQNKDADATHTEHLHTPDIMTL